MSAPPMEPWMYASAPPQQSMSSTNNSFAQDEGVIVGAPVEDPQGAQHAQSVEGVIVGAPIGGPPNTKVVQQGGVIAGAPIGGPPNTQFVQQGGVIAGAPVATPVGGSAYMNASQYGAMMAGPPVATSFGSSANSMVAPHGMTTGPPVANSFGSSANSMVVQQQALFVAPPPPACPHTVVNYNWDPCGVVCAVCFFPWGIICCLAMSKKTCRTCGSDLGSVLN